MLTQESPARTIEPSRRRTRLGLALILLVSLALRLAPIEHGLPANYVPDTHIVNSALGMAKDKDLVPEVSKYSSYPNLLPYMLLPVYALEYGAGRATGEWGSAAEFGNHALERPEGVHLSARLLVALLSSLLPLVAFFAARAMGMRSGAWVAAWLAATGLMGVHFSTQERPWEPMVLFMLLSTWPAARYVVGEARRALVLAGVAAGLAFATHQAGGAALLVPALAWALVFVRSRGELGTKARGLLLDGVVCVVAFGLVGLALGHPYLLVHGSTDTGAVVMGDTLEKTKGAISLGGQGFVLALRPASFVRLATALVSYDPVLVLLGLGGLLFAWRKRCLWPALGLLVAWGALFLFSSNDHVRYLLPLVGLLCLPAGLFFERVAPRLPRVAALLVFGLLLGFPLVQAARLDYVLDQPDVRAGAAEDLAADGLFATGARLAVGRYGPELPLSRQSLERIASVRPLGAREAHRLAQLVAFEADGLDPNDPAIGPPGGAGLDVVYISDFFDFDDRRGSYHSKTPGLEGMDADAVLDALGVTHVLLADKTPGDGTVSLLVGPKTGWRDGQPSPAPLAGLVFQSVWFPGPMEFDSRNPLGAAPGGPLEARLPTELDDALCSIWSVGRPGPALYLFERSGP